MHRVERGWHFSRAIFSFIYTAETLQVNAHREINKHAWQSAQSYSTDMHAYSQALTHGPTMLPPYPDAQSYTYIGLLHIDTYAHLQAHAPWECAHELHPGTSKLKHIEWQPLGKHYLILEKCPGKEKPDAAQFYFHSNIGKTGRVKIICEPRPKSRDP